MGRIYPAENRIDDEKPVVRSHRVSSWTVWKKSSMAFQGTDGFSVYDSNGGLAFRVDNYSRRHKRLAGELVLMDGAGAVLFALRPQIFSMHDQWNGFKEEKEGLRAGSKRHVFSMRKRSVLQSSDETDVFMVSSGGHLSPKPDYRIEGCFWRRNCKIRGSSGEVLAKISRKKANSSTILSDDVFSLTVEQGADCELIMAFMVVLDRICQKPFSPILCSSNAVH
ncbi:protein LURP-one-related 5-like [Dioscorea cayenensis subsp. rotundata]|uniref:Protein LURP-one-related 5-like n=1 Tax=Dioscorea cayennensis subsp. rotundata TaxID=55577 RepID=A0AB40C2K8_DIOCR|nr:protein LURP-one-related 5-like [Dioscorea cayenensis subsp. rotundata]